MNGFYVYTGNYLEALAERLARIVRKPLSDPFAPEMIVVQSSGMQRWISMELARHNDVCANCRFPFPNRFLDDLFSRMNPDLPEKSLYDPGLLAFHIMQLLPECIENPVFKSLQLYLRDDKNQLKLHQLSQKIADTFDQYLVFRTDMIFSWEAGRADHWQAVLWRRLSANIEARHRAALREDLFDWICSQHPGIRNLPERVSVFGISYLPSFHLQVLAEISRHIPVYFYLLNPSKEYWADIVSAKEMARFQQKPIDAAAAGESAGDWHLESGNRLLASLGALGRDFFKRITATDFSIEEQFRNPGRRSLLACIQSDILNLTEPHPKIEVLTPRQFGADRSVQIHSCHSPMREVEVLYDHLLDRLASDPKLMPRDIVVMTPDIETYGPVIQAVFDVQDENDVRIPFVIADRSFKRESPVIQAFLSILDLKDSRFGATRILSLLEIEVVRKKFKLSAADLETLLHWITETQIRWGRDAACRREFSPEGFPENTWRQGLDRLLLGYAMPGYEKNMFNGILPYDFIEGQDSLLLGRLIEFIESVFEYIDTMDTKNKLSGWSLICNQMLERFIEASTESTHHDMQILRTVFGKLEEIEALSGYQEAVVFEVVRTIIQRHLENENYGYGFISGGVTFCAMLPMRSIPFKVVCLLGMNSDAFPRESRPLGFDFISKHPRPGDRSRRNDDKYLFLEALISAREALYISYIGQSLQDNSRLPPSVLVSELIDYIKTGYGFPEDRIITCHPLQAFASVYFNENERFFSYSEENLLGAQRVAENSGGKQEPPAFISGSLPILPEEIDKWKRIELEDFCQFWANPVKFLLQQRLGIYLEEKKLLPEERENFNIDTLEKYFIGQEIVRKKISEGKFSELLPLFRAQGRLPVGSVGRVVFHQLESEAEKYIHKCRPYLSGQAFPPLDILFSLDGFRLVGRLVEIYPSVGLVHFHFANLQVKYLLNAWIHHLIYSLFKKDCFPDGSCLVCKDALWTFDPVPDAEQLLLNLLKFFREGILKPFHFFPETSFVYARQLLLKGKNQPAAMSAARQKWAGSEFQRGESQDPYLSLLFRRFDPFNSQFHEAAAAVFTPVFQCGRESTD